MGKHGKNTEGLGRDIIEDLEGNWKGTAQDLTGTPTIECGI